MTNISKKFNPVVLASVLATTIAAMPNALAFERGERGHRGAASFSRIDVNQDSLLSLDELTTPKLAKAERKFTHKDSDADSLLSFEEFQQTRSGSTINLAEVADQLVLCVTELKAELADDNITIPTAEQFLSQEEKFATIDSNGDDVISLDELHAKVVDKAAMAFIQMDTNADNMVDEDEFNAAQLIRSATKQAIRQCLDEINSGELV